MKMKKLLTIIVAVVMIVSCVACLTACKKKTYEIAVVTDVGQLMDGGFNQGTYEGAKAYAEANKKTYQYYQPANGSDATDNDRIEAMNKAIANGAKIIVAPGFLQADAMKAVATKNPDVKFIFIDGWNLGLSNVTAVSYKEEESGYMAGYAAVMDGYTKLGATLGGGGTNPACNRFGYGYVQGAIAAAAEKSVTGVEVKVSFQYGSNFSASTELQTQISGWYANGTEVVFACGGSMFQSVKSAAEETTNGKIIGVDVDQASLSERVITSAVKGLSESVQLILGQFYAGDWDTKLADKTSNLGAAENATGLPTAESSWRMSNFTVASYKTLFNAIKNGTIAIPTTPCTGDCGNAAVWTALSNDAVTVIYE